ncbi:hypothetical protein HNP82_000390 [Catenibacillus scindens]|uniref:Uncharacterized protein n=1 Tax=Catenibacillus scindens TaxID=673271 RepID=A0A7W8H7G2_9FIRM|nr:hypothetical protein [Catenibacillus scindens]MBB5263296.1 hypothetical protein [Catenibacillus scindens]
MTARDGLLYAYNPAEDLWEPLCQKENCPHSSITEDPASACQGAVDPGCAVGYDKDMIYTAACEGNTLRIKEKEPYTEDYRVIKKISDFTWRAYNGASFNAVFDNGYIYYTYFRPGGIDILPAIELRRCLLEADSAGEEVLYSSSFQGKTPSVVDVHFYPGHMAILYHLSEPGASRFYYGIYTFSDEKWREYPVPTSALPAYCPGKIIYINPENEMEVYDLKGNAVCASFVPEEFHPDSIVISDGSFIYICHSEDALEGNGGDKILEDLYEADIYDMNGKYMGRFPAPDTVAFGFILSGKDGAAGLVNGH